jgi:GrpB-like predicted nucleotidyltransferase (UPF0157 family)
MLGVDRKTVLIVPYDPEWNELFKSEADLLRNAVSELAVAIEHIGSTAVPGLAAKPIVDIVLAVRTSIDAQKCVPLVKEIGYEYKGEAGIPGRHYFRKGGPDVSTHHLHVVEANRELWRSHLLFRDYLRTHPDAIGEYAALKHKLAIMFKDDRPAYTEAKSDFIRDILNKAGSAT